MSHKYCIFEERNISKTVIEFISRKSNNEHATLALGSLKLELSGFIFIISLIIILFYFPDQLIFGISLLGVYISGKIYIYNYTIVEESIIIMKNFGIQLRKKYKNGNEDCKFIEKHKICKVFIHEAIQFNKITMSLAIMVYHEDSLNLCFLELYPGFNALKKVFVNCLSL